MRQDSLAIVVVGASVGGLDALRQLFHELPPDLPAAVFVTVHLAPDRPSLLVELLAKRTDLSVAQATDLAPIEAGQVYLAPPDHHLLVHRGHMRVVRGPRENGFRPAIDPMFRSAARTYGRRVIGILLTGALDDGTAGLITLKRYGGLAIVQDPREAFEPQMPRSALEHVAVDLCLPIADIALVLPREAAACAGRPKPRSDDPAVDYELSIAELDADALTEAHKPGVPSLLSCPDCTGVLSAVHEGGMERFRCQVGHAYSLESLLDAQDHSIERALWTSVRALLEKLNLLRRVAGRMHANAQERGHVRLEERILQLETDIAVLRGLLLGRSDVRAPARSEETSPPEEGHAARPTQRRDEYAS